MHNIKYYMPLQKDEIKMFEINIPTQGLPPFQVEDITNRMKLIMITTLFDYLGYDFKTERLESVEKKEVKIVTSIRKL
jgi:hypothetical protein